MSKKSIKVAELDKLIGISKEIVEESEVVKKVTKKEIAEVKATPLVKLNNEQFITDLGEDYAETRASLKNLISKGETALEGILDVADDTDHPRAFEVVATLIKTISEVSNNLIELQKMIRDLTSTPGDTNPNPVTPAEGDAQVMMVGSFTDLLDMLDEAEKKKEEKSRTIDGVTT